MNWKKFILASVAVFIMYQVLNFLIHSIILGGIYEQTAALWRPDMEKYMWVMYAGDLVKTFLFVLIFIKSIYNRGWAGGLRFGLLLGLYAGVGMGFSTYATTPIPFTLAVQWFIFAAIQLMVCGIVAALIYKPAKT